VTLLSTSNHSTPPRTATSGAPSSFDGAALPAGIKAPAFTLTNQSGNRVSLADYRGHVVVIAFLYSTCGATCVVIGQQIRGALDELEEAHAKPPAVLIVSADAAADSRANVARFLAEVSLTGRVQYLTGTAQQLQRVWHAYAVKPASAGRRVFAEYASVLLVDGQGSERVLFQSEQLTPESLSHDIRTLAGERSDP
jgi:cytochrome oxidase Cu insertion factor (SCO1/SenC/PrrC family)